MDGFRLEVGEPLALGIRRIVLGQVDRCVHLLRHEPDVDRAVHEMRKSLKRVRAVVRLTRGELGRFRYREENIVLRDTARGWAGLRDAAVTATVAAEVTADPDVVGEVLSRRLVGELQVRADNLRAGLGGDRRLRTDTLTTLLCFRARVAGFPVTGEGAFPDRFAAIRPGLHRIARRAAAGLDAAEARPTAPALHEWRKDVKYLRHQIEVVRPVWEDRFDALAARLSLLGDVLGDDHDLAELAALVEADHDLVPGEEWRHRLVAAIEERRRPLQAEAFALGRSLLGSPRALVDEVGAAWAYARP